VLLLDNSAWARLDSAALAGDRRAEGATMIQAGDLAVCTPFLLEASWSAQSLTHQDELLADCSPFPGS
jgi:hypothetical protein